MILNGTGILLNWNVEFIHMLFNRVSIVLRIRKTRFMNSIHYFKKQAYASWYPSEHIFVPLHITADHFHIRFHARLCKPLPNNLVNYVPMTRFMVKRAFSRLLFIPKIRTRFLLHSVNRFTLSGHILRACLYNIHVEMWFSHFVFQNIFLKSLITLMLI